MIQSVAALSLPIASSNILAFPLKVTELSRLDQPRQGNGDAVHQLERRPDRGLYRHAKLRARLRNGGAGPPSLGMHNHSYLAAIAVVFCRNGSVALG